MNRGLVIGGGIAVLVLALLGGGIWYANQSMPGPVPTVVETGTGVEAVDPAGVEPRLVEVEIEGGGFRFTPNQIAVKRGDTVRLTYNVTEAIHDLVIDEYSVATRQLGAGQQGIVEFVADRAGTFEFYCSVGNHRQLGMAGTLIVE